jgi:hypothetical protein
MKNIPKIGLKENPPLNSGVPAVIMNGVTAGDKAGKQQ